MRAIDDGFNTAGARQLADGFHRSELASNIDHVRNKKEPGAVGDSFFKRRDGVRSARLLDAASTFLNNEATVADESAARPRPLPERERKSRRVHTCIATN